MARSPGGGTVSRAGGHRATTTYLREVRRGARNGRGSGRDERRRRRLLGVGGSGRTYSTAVRCEARDPLRQAATARLAAPRLVRTVAGRRTADVGIHAWRNANYRPRRLHHERERVVRGQRAVPPRQLDGPVAVPAATAGPRDDLLADRGNGHSGVPPVR